MNRFLSILLLSVFLINCTSNTIIKKPDNLIPKNQMVDLLTDLLVASSAENIKNLQLKRKVNYYPLVFEKYHIDSAQFRESNYYYSTKVDEYDQIIREVEARLEGLVTQFEDERRLNDSISNSKIILKEKDDDDGAYIK